MDENHPEELLKVATVFPLLLEKLDPSYAAMSLVEAMDPWLWPLVVLQLVECAEGHPGVSFGELSPALRNWALHPIDGLVEKLDLAPLRKRTRTVLMQNQITTWGDLVRCTPLEAGSFLNSGVTTVRDLIRVAIELGAAAAATISDSDVLAATARSTSEVLNLMKSSFETDIAYLAQWALQETDISTVGEAMDYVLAEQLIPLDIAHVVREIRSSLLQTHVPESKRVPVVLSTLLAELSDHDAQLIRRRTLSLTPPTLEELGREFGVTRERVRQIQHRAELRFEELLGKPEFRSIQWRAGSIRRSLGTCAPLHDSVVAVALDRAVRNEPDDTAAFQNLLLKLAGPYRMEREFLVSISSMDLKTSLEQLADEFGVMQGADVTSVLNEYGVAERFHMEVIAWCGGFRAWEDNYLLWPSSGVEKAITVLALRGTPATIEEIIDDIGETYSDRSLQGRIAEDPRVARTNRHQFALKSWGYDEYSTIADAIASQIERDGGESNVTALARKVSGAFGVRESSVRMYAEAPMFSISNGLVRIRTADEAIEVSQDISDCRGVYILGSDEIALLVEVDFDVLRGSGRSIPQALAARLGVLPGAKVAFGSDFGDVIVSWPITSATGPSIGSTRLCGIGVGCEDGQFMRLSFNIASGTVAVHAVGQWVSTCEPSTRAVAEITGIRVTESDDLLGALSESIGVAKSGLRRALAVRGDDFVLRMIPREEMRADLGAALQELVKALGEGG